MNSILLKPVISEQSLRDANNGKFTFIVNPKSDKTEIKKAVEDLFSVKVEKITTTKSRGSVTRMTKFGRKKTEFLNKKARVVLSKGQTIDIFEEHLGGNEKDNKKKKSKIKEIKKEESK